MDDIILKMRSNNPPEVFKSIRVIGPHSERFTGNFRYIRLFYKGYDYKAGDILDNQILESIKSIFPDSHFNLNILALFDKQYEDCIKITKGGTIKTIVTYFYPIVDYFEETPKELKAFYIGLSLSLAMNPGDPRLNNIIDSLIVNIPYDELHNLIKTIKPV